MPARKQDCLPHDMKRIVALAGGVGAARFLDGLVRLVPPGALYIICNTGDDAEIHGLHVSPDIDTVLYALAGLSDPRRGWGLRGDTFHCLERLGRLGAETWFQLGDRDLATHLYRTERLHQGATLSVVTRDLAAAMGVQATVIPMSDHPLRTRILTLRGGLEFQEWFVKRRCRDRVLRVRFEGGESAKPAPGVIEAIGGASAIILCPSNPIISIGPILKVPGIREALRRASAPIAAISPIVAGRALKGPAARMMKSMGLQASARQVALLYRDFLDTFILDRADERQARSIEALGMRVVVADTIMTSLARKKELARVALNAMGFAAS